MGMSSTGLTENTAALLCYVLGLMTILKNGFNNKVRLAT